LSWSSVAGPPRSGSESVSPGATGSVAAVPPSEPGQPWADQTGPSQPGSSQPGSSQPGGTLTSHRRQAGIGGPGEPGQPAAAQPPPGRPRGPRWYRRPRWLAALV